MKNPFPLILAPLAAAAMLSCAREPLCMAPPEGDGVRVRIELCCEPLPTEESGGGTRSTHPATALTSVSNINYYLFHDGTLARQEYFPDADDFTVILPSGTQTYNLYLLANVGRVTIPSGTAEADMGEAVCVDYQTRENYFSTIAADGFPMSRVLTGFGASSGGRYSLKRLVHTLYVTADTDALQVTSMTFTGVRIRQAPRNVFPFAAGGSKATATIDGDAANLSAADLDRLNAGQTVTLYLLENMRGDLIPGNSSWRNKVPSAIASQTERALASYIEMSATVVTPTATYENNVYRAYLGRDAANFDCERSTYFMLRNNFTSDMVVGDDWRLVADDPTITGTLCFADTRYTSATAPSGYQTNTVENEYRRPFRTVSKIYAMKGLKSLYYIYRSDPRISYTITTNETSRANPRISLKAQEVDDHFVALLIGSNVDFSTATTYETVNGRRAYYENAYPYTRNPYESETSNTKIYITSYDGLLKDSLLVQCLDRKPSLRFTYTNNGWSSDVISGTFQYKVSNPLGLRIYTYFYASYVSTVTYYPKGTYSSSSTSTRRVTGERSWRYSAAKYGTVSIQDFSIHYTASGSSTYTSYTGGSGSGKLSDLFTCGWDLYGKNYTTGLAVGSNWYNKHAEPKSLAMQVQFQYDLPCPQRMFPDIGLGWSERLPLNVQNICPDLSLGVGKTDGSASCVNFGEDIGVAITSGVKSGGTSTTTYNMMEANRNNYPTGISNMKDFTMSLYNSMPSVNDYTEAWGPNKAYAYQTSSSTSPSLLTGTAFTELRMTTRTDYAPSGHYAWDEWMLDLGFTNDGSGNYSGNIAVNLFGSTVVD